MTVKAMMATILQKQMALRGVQSLTPTDYDEIVKELVEQLRELELGNLRRLNISICPR